ncbi:MAG: hypothetical protein ACRCWG_06500 [Sarcina sp.]
MFKIGDKVKDKSRAKNGIGMVIDVQQSWASSDKQDVEVQFENIKEPMIYFDYELELVRC